jgi:hypothetical protein
MFSEPQEPPPGLPDARAASADKFLRKRGRCLIKIGDRWMLQRMADF